MVVLLYNIYMVEKYIPPIPTPEENRKISLEAFFGLLGVRESPEDQNEIIKSVESLRTEIEKSPQVGRILEQNKAHREEFVIPLTSSEQREKILEHLANLGIFPWEENGLIIIDHRKDLEKLRLAGLVRGKYYEEVKEIPEVTVGQNIEEKLYQFPLPEIPPTERRVQTRRKIAIEKSEEEIESGIDIELIDIIQKFDQGILDEDDEEFQSQFGNMPTLTLFPHKYIWKKGILTHARTGEVFTTERQKGILEKAQAGDEKAREEYIRMNIGFVLFFTKRIQKRFGGDMDELFQEGLIGLDRAITLAESERETKFTTYAAYWIEQRMRRFLINNRNDVRTPIHRQSDKGGVHALRNKEQKKKQLLGPQYDIPENQEYINNIYRLERRLLIGAQFDPIEDHFDEEAWQKQDAFGKPLFQIPEQERISEYTDLRTTIQEILYDFSSRERLILAARFGLEMPFMAPEELAPFIQKRGIEINEEGNILNIEELEPIDLFALYVSNHIKVLPKEIHTEDGFTLEAIGNFFGVTKDRIRQIEGTVLRRMKRPSRSRKLRAFLDRYKSPEQPYPETDIPFVPSEEVSKENVSVEEIRNNLNPEQQVAPEGWQTRHAVSELPGVSDAIIRQQERINLQEHPEWLRVYKGINGQIGEHLHPELIEKIRIAAIAQEIDGEILEEIPEGWEKVTDLSQEFHMEALDIRLLALNYQSSNPEWFKKVQGEEIFHPELVEILRERIAKSV